MFNINIFNLYNSLFLKRLREFVEDEHSGLSETQLEEALHNEIERFYNEEIVYPDGFWDEIDERFSSHTTVRYTHLNFIEDVF